MSYPGQQYHDQNRHNGGGGGYGGGGPQMPGVPQGYNQPSYGNYGPPQGPPPGQYGGGGPGGFPQPYGGGGGGGYGPPSGPPPGQGYGGGYGPPSGPPPGQYGAPSGPPPGQGYGGGGGGGGGGYNNMPSGPPTHYGAPAGMGGGPIGPPEYQNQPVRYERPQGPQMHGDMRYEYSSMTGKRKALLIGINYVGSRAELRGCHNDVENMKNFIMQRAGYKTDDMVILTDRPGNDMRSIPTRQNITAAMNWLIRGAQPGDALFFHYSGHGGQAKASQGDEADGYNETILPLDYEQAGQMEDDEMHALLVRPLPIGCRLTALFDSCHSGTALDLPFVYATSGQIKEPNVVAGVGKGLLSAGMAYARGDMGGLIKGLFGTFNEARNTESAEAFTKANRASGADVVMLSGCKDSQTSADATEAGKATGAMSWAFIKVLTEYPQLTYSQLLNATTHDNVLNINHDNGGFIMFSSELAQLRRMGVRAMLLQALNFLTVISSALAMYKGLSILTNTESPVVVVLSGSMEPAFYRGDLLFLSMPSGPLRVGDITVYKVPGADIPIVHRVLEVHDEPGDGLNQLILTKGDNNDADDIALYNGPSWIRRKNIVGKVRGYLPFVGYVTILLNDYPKLKYVILGALGLSMLFTKE
ncbi:Ca(2+)-dependent cysteine protease [Tilletia horrida]|nr:Ca(2+)-dependent cysteine protease [Tilletia horrida]